MSSLGKTATKKPARTFLRCHIAGQNNQSQRWAFDASSGRLHTANGRCLWLTENASVATAPGRKITISANCSAPAAQWQLKPQQQPGGNNGKGGNYSLRHGPTGLCAAVDSNLEFVTAVACDDDLDNHNADEASDRHDGGGSVAPPLRQQSQKPPGSNGTRQSWAFDRGEGYLSSVAGLPMRFGAVRQKRPALSFCSIFFMSQGQLAIL